jgi:hypothetical protein
LQVLVPSVRGWSVVDRATRSTDLTSLMLRYRSAISQTRERNCSSNQTNMDRQDVLSARWEAFEEAAVETNALGVVIEALGASATACALTLRIDAPCDSIGRFGGRRMITKSKIASL